MTTTFVNREIAAVLAAPMSKEPRYTTAECALCYHVGPCVDDGEAYICVERIACVVRARTQIEETQVEQPSRVSSICIYCDEWEIIAHNALTKVDDGARQIAQLRADLDDAHQHVGALTKAIDELDTLGEWVWSEPDEKTLLSIHLTEAHHTELMDSMDAARTWLRRGAK